MPSPLSIVKVATFAGALAIGALSAPLANAGPPYLTDDPAPTDLGHWEIYSFVTAFTAGPTVSGAAGLDLNYGGAKDLQLTATIPLDFQGTKGLAAPGLRAGAGDIELAAKYRLLHQTDGTWAPDLAVFPRLFVPTAGPPFGTGRLGLLLPVWVEKDAGSWSVFGGGGYQINPGAGQRDFWQGGLAVTHSFGERLAIGPEVFAQGDSANTGGGFLALNLGASWRLTKHWSLLALAGPVWQAPTNGMDVYWSLKADY